MFYRLQQYITSLLPYLHSPMEPTILTFSQLSQFQNGGGLFCRELKIYLNPPHSTSLSFFIPTYQFIHPVIHPLTALMPPQIFTHSHPNAQNFRCILKPANFTSFAPLPFPSYPNYNSPSCLCLPTPPP